LFSSEQRSKSWNPFPFGNVSQNWIYFLFEPIKRSGDAIFELFLQHSKRIEVLSCCIRQIWRVG
jgi:hypothetical protein